MINATAGLSAIQAYGDRAAFYGILIGRRKHGERFIGVRTFGSEVRTVFWGRTRIPAVKRGA